MPDDEMRRLKVSEVRRLRLAEGLRKNLKRRKVTKADDREDSRDRAPGEGAKGRQG